MYAWLEPVYRRPAEGIYVAGATHLIIIDDLPPKAYLRIDERLGGFGHLASLFPMLRLPIDAQELLSERLMLLKSRGAAWLAWSMGVIGRAVGDVASMVDEYRVDMLPAAVLAAYKLSIEAEPPHPWLLAARKTLDDLVANCTVQPDPDFAKELAEKLIQKYMGGDQH